MPGGVWWSLRFLYKVAEKASLRRWHLSEDPNHVEIRRRGRGTRECKVEARGDGDIGQGGKRGWRWSRTHGTGP